MATEQTEEEGPTSCVAEAHESDGAGAPPVAEAGNKAEAPRTSVAETIEVSAAGPVARDSEMEVGQPLVPPLAQGLPPSQESAQELGVQATSPADISQGMEAADVEADSTAEQPVLAPSEGDSALARVRPEPHGWNHPRISWLSQDDPEGKPLFALEDAVEGGRWSSFEQYRRLAVQSLRTALSVMDVDLPGVAQVCVFFSRAVSSCSESFRNA